MTGIYVITNKINGHQYVGLSQDIDRRWAEHVTPKNIRNKKTNLGKAFRKYGVDNFSFNVIEECPVEQLASKEIFWIEQLRPVYNMTKGGDGVLGLEVTKEVRAKISATSKMIWQNKSEEEKQSLATKEKRRRALSLICKGNKRGNKKVIAYNDLNFYTFESIKEGAEFFGVNPSCVTGVLKGKRKHTAGMSWSYWGVETIGDECSRVGVILPHIEVRDIRKDEEIVHSHEIVNREVSDKGLIQLAIRSGLFAKINNGIVYEGMLQDYDYLSGSFRLDPSKKVSDKVVGYFAYLLLNNGTSEDRRFGKSLYMSREEVEAHAKRYSQTYSSKYDYVRASSKWTTDFDAMAKKTVLKLLLQTWAPMSTEIQSACNADQAVIREDGVLDYVDNTPDDQEQKESAVADKKEAIRARMQAEAPMTPEEASDFPAAPAPTSEDDIFGSR